MKKLIAIIGILTIMFACNSGTYTEPYDYVCDRPIDIPDTLYNGAEVYWDCDWQWSYKAGNVSVKWDSTKGGAVWVKRILTPKQK